MPLSEQPDVAELRAYYEKHGRAARDSGQVLRCSERTVTDAVIELISPHLPSLSRVLDVGCGANLEYDLVLANRGVQVVAVDFAESFLAMAPRHALIEVKWADATALPFESETFDAVICSETLEHIPNDRAVISEIARVLPPRGLLVITVPLLWNVSRLLEMVRRRSLQVTMMEGHLREYTRSQVLQLLRSHFDVERIVPVPFGWRGPFGTPLDALVRAGPLARGSKSFAALARRRN
jgi:SAM-dependent methyltransferase